MTIKTVTLGGDDLVVEVVPSIGARIHRIRAFGSELLRTPKDVSRHVDDPWFWGSYPLAPWCNRLPTTPIAVEGRTVALRPNFPDGTAIHGQVAQAAWTDDRGGRFSILAGGDGWPWTYRVDQAIDVEPGRLSIALRLENRAATSMPAGLGIHPWFRDPVDVSIRAATVYPSNLDPGSPPVAVSGDLDRRSPGPLAIGVDATWTDLEDPPIVLEWPGVRATIETSPGARYVVAAHLPGVDATAVEPETHAPGGLQRLLAGQPGGLALLAPGDSLELIVTLRIERTDT